MQQIYLNWAATSYEKFPATIQACCDYLQQNTTANFQRNLSQIDLNPLCLDARLALAEFFQAPDASHIIFTANVTTALNMVLNGLLKAGDHVITTQIEHNAVSRPLHLLKKTLGVEVTVVPCNSTGEISLAAYQAAFKKNTKAVVINHASNVLGTILPIAELFQYAKKKGVVTILDAAQTAGYLPLEMQRQWIDVLCFTGHKSLMGLAGSGGFLVNPEVADKIDPWLVGGTGSFSESLEMPKVLPDKFEAGTENLLGILSLTEAVKQLQKVGLPEIQKKEESLLAYFLAEIEGLPLRILGPKNPQKQVPVVSVVPEKMDPAEFSQALFETGGIITRCGVHCAPWAHEAAGTLKTGATRFSFGYFTKEAELAQTVKIMRKILM